MTKQLSAMMEPMTIVFLAGIVGFMIVALYMPMFTMYGAISGN
jgi:type IV pilus assembly protein PilC